MTPRTTRQVTTRQVTAGQVIVITGATSGIGRALALRCAAPSCHLILLGRRERDLAGIHEQVSQAGGQATLVCCDMAKPQDLDDLGARLSSRLDRIDRVILNAAMLGELSPVALAEPDHWSQVLTINVLAQQRLLASLDPLIRRSLHARIILLTCAPPPRPAYWGAYRASKAAASELVQAYGDETPRTTVSIIDPGPTDTRLHRQAFPGSNLTRSPEQAALRVFEHMTTS